MSATEDPRQAARRIVAEVLASHEMPAVRDAVDPRLLEVDVVDVSRLESQQGAPMVSDEVTGTGADADPRALARRIVADVLAADRVRRAQERPRAGDRHHPAVPVPEREVQDTAPPVEPESPPDFPPDPTADAPPQDSEPSGPPAAPESPPAQEPSAASGTPTGVQTPLAPESEAPVVTHADVADAAESSPGGTQTPGDDIAASATATSVDRPGVPAGDGRGGGSAADSSHAPTPVPIDRSSSAAADLDDEIDPEPVREPPRTGRWLLTTVLAALALAWLFPLAVAALRDLVAL